MIYKLTNEEFKATFKAPMRLLGENDEPSAVDITDYTEKIITAESLDISISDIQIHYIYHNFDSTFEQVLLNYGIENLFLVIVINLKSTDIAGYYILNLNEKYGVN